NVELNAASINHLNLLMHQMLSDCGIQRIEEWKSVIKEMLLQVCSKLNPDVRNGDEIDIRHYVKVKKIPGGVIQDSHFVTGIVASKSVIHKQMLIPVRNPKILLLTFPLEYQRVENQFISLEPLIAQEKDHLRHLVSRVTALKPDVVMVEKTCARVAFEFLLEAKIIVISSVKISLLSAVARCTNAEIIHSIDKLSAQKMGTCDRLSFKTFINPHIPGYRKTFLYVEGVPEGLGCTLVLRGASLSDLAKIKQIVDFLVFVVYSLKLETCLFQDEYAMTPEVEPQPDLAPAPELDPLKKAIKMYQSIILSGSPNVHFPPPYQLKNAPLLKNVPSASTIRDTSSALSTIGTVETEPASLLNPDRLSPLAHQTLVVLFSNNSPSNLIPCSSPQPHLIEYYRDSDLTLGQFIEDTCFASTDLCTSKGCEKQMLVHNRTYSHGEGKVTVTVNSLPCPVKGMDKRIVMWSLCRVCSETTPFIPMSEETWKYSFGKYLELTFYHTNLSSRSFTCTHDVHRDHMRYFSFKNLAVRFEYEKISLFEVCGPPMHRKLKAQTLMQLRQGDMELLKTQIVDFYNSVIERIQMFTYEIVAPYKTAGAKEAMNELSKRAVGEKKLLLQLLHQTYIESEPTDSLALNSVYKTLQLNVAQWDQEFLLFIRNFLSTDAKEIRRVTAAQFKRIFADKETAPLDSRNTIGVTEPPRTETETDHYAPIEKSKLPVLDMPWEDGELEYFTPSLSRRLSLSLAVGMAEAHLPKVGSSPTHRAAAVPSPPPAFYIEDEDIPLMPMSSLSDTEMIANSLDTQHFLSINDNPLYLDEKGTDSLGARPRELTPRSRPKAVH
ncbi:1-phosphatidylinositol-3-phosphate 5-kinase, partial [Kappamyces sp. JEL0680]